MIFELNAFHILNFLPYHSNKHLKRGVSKEKTDQNRKVI